MKVVWTNGCFDVLHTGHVKMLEYAKSLGDYLVVGVDTDKRVKAAKGPSRPINCLEDRVEMLKSIKYVDDVVFFDSDEQLSFKILSSEAEIMVVGSDYKDKNVIGSRHVKKVKYFSRVGSHSTTSILEKL